MKSISVQYQELKEGKMDKHQFLRNARMMFPNFVTNLNSFDDSVKILKNKGLLNEGDAVKGTPDKAPTYDSPTPDAKTKYKKVEQSPEVDEQDGVYPATTLTDIPKVKANKKVKDTSDGLEPIKPHDTKNEMKKVGPLKEAIKNIIRKTLNEINQKKTLNEGYELEDSQNIDFELYDIPVDSNTFDLFGTIKVTAEKAPANYIDGYLESGDFWYVTNVELVNLEAAYISGTEDEISPDELNRLQDVISRDRRTLDKLFDYAEEKIDYSKFDEGEPDPDRYRDDF